MLVLVVFNALLFYFFRQVSGRDSRIADFIQSNDTQILSEAQQKAKSIIEAAMNRAKQTLTEADYVREDLMKRMEQLLTDVANKDVESLQTKSLEINQWYKKLLGGIEEQHTKQAEQSIKSVENVAAEEIKGFRENLEKETLQSERAVAEKVSTEFAKVKEDLEVYKQKKMTEIAQAANLVVIEVTEEVLGSAISIQDHQKIVINALEKAKKEGLFSSKS